MTDARLQKRPWYFCLQLDRISLRLCPRVVSRSLSICPCVVLSLFPVQGSFNLQPNGVWASFGTVTRYLPTSTIYNLRNLEDVEQLVQDIVSGDMEDLEEADRCGLVGIS